MKTIACHKAEQLLSPFIDGAISPQEEILLRTHLLSCEKCAAEYETYKNISAAIKALPRATCRDPDFSNRVINSISSMPSQKSSFPRNTIWKKGLAAAAVAALIFAGSLSLGDGIQFIQTAQHRSNEGPGPETPQLALVKEPDKLPVENPVSDPEPGQKVERSNNEQQPEAGVQNNADPAKPAATNKGNEQGNPPEDREPVQTEPAAVLLDSNLTVESTILKVNVANAEQARTQVEALVGNSGSSRLLSNQNTANGTIAILRLTVDKNDAARVVNGITSLGTTVERQADNRNITSQYNNLVSRYNELPSNSGDQTLEDEKTSIKQQMDILIQDSKNHTILLWLIQK